MRLQAVLHGIPRGETNERCHALLERVGLTRAADRRVGTYSGGMRRRLDLAMALVHEPPVLFLDEPTTGLDPTSRQAIWKEVRRLNDDGTTVFLTTQYLEEADQLADRVAIIDDGRMVASGTPDELKEDIGRYTLEVCVAGDEGRAEEVLARFGDVMPARNGTLELALQHGATQVAAIVRALDDAGLAVESLDLHEPTLDDVFAEKTGRRLEGAGDQPAPA
jgi:ABC-2 type transport system ATP-binding protein